MKVVINKCYGGFGLSAEAHRRLRELGHAGALTEPAVGEPWDPKDPSKLRDGHTSFGYDYKREDPLLVRVVEELGDKANGCCAKLRVVDIPDGINWDIGEYDGIERIEEHHRTWG